MHIAECIIIHFNVYIYLAPLSRIFKYQHCHMVVLVFNLEFFPYFQDDTEDILEPSSERAMKSLLVDDFQTQVIYTI